MRKLKIKKVDDKPMVIHTKQKAKIDSFGKGMREAGQKVANTFRTFADKEERIYRGMWN